MKLDHSLKASSAILKGTTFCINNNNYKNSYLYLRSNDKSNFALLRNLTFQHKNDEKSGRSFTTSTAFLI